MKKIMEYLREVVPPSSPIRWGYSAARGMATAAAFGLPGRGVRGIGVTGTDGKTTTTAMIAHLLRGAGQRVVESNSLGITHANGRQQAIAQKRTTPSARVMQLLFRAARAERAALITELSSHALLHRRAAGLRLDVAVLTNLSAEHLDMHGSLEHYLRAKSAIFWRHLRPRGVALVGAGPGCDALARRLGQRFRVERLTKPNNISTLQTGGTRFCWQGEIIEMPAMGAEIMATNMAAALTAAQHFLQKKYGTKDEKVHREALISAAKTFAGVPGRMQRVPLLGAEFLAFVDFAVTPAAVRAALAAARAQIGRGGRVIGVCGRRGRPARPRQTPRRWRRAGWWRGYWHRHRRRTLWRKARTHPRRYSARPSPAARNPRPPPRHCRRAAARPPWRCRDCYGHGGDANPHPCQRKRAALGRGGGASGGVGGKVAGGNRHFLSFQQRAYARLKNSCNAATSGTMPVEGLLVITLGWGRLFAFLMATSIKEKVFGNILAPFFW